jgi:hypothetical protein
VFVNGDGRTPTFNSSTSLSVTLTSTDLASAGIVTIKVGNYNAGFGCSVSALAPVSFLVTP